MLERLFSRLAVLCVPLSRVMCLRVHFLDSCPAIFDYTAFVFGLILTSVWKWSDLHLAGLVRVTPIQASSVSASFIEACDACYDCVSGLALVSCVLLFLLLTVVKLLCCRFGCSPGGKRFMKCTSCWFGRVCGPLRGRPFLVKPMYQPA